MSLRPRIRVAVSIGVVAVIVCILNSAAIAATPTTRPMGRPALELKKVISFPIEGNSLPDTQEGLARAISAALHKRLELPEGATPVRAQGARYPFLDQLTVDFTDAAVKSDHRPPKLLPSGRTERTIRAKQFQVIADPMKIDGAAMYLRIMAEDVDLGMQRDPKKKPILVVTSARNGQLQFHTTQADLSRMFTASANFRGQRYGLNVTRATLKLTSDDEHQLKADLRLRSVLLLMPIQLHFTARVDVQDNGTAHLSNLSCDGDDAAGWLISGFIGPALKKYNGQTMPLVAFPSEQIKVRNLSVKLDGDDVKVAAAFGT